MQSNSVMPLFEHRKRLRKLGENLMLYTVVVVLIVLWLLGLIGNIGGGLVHILLVIAVIVLAYNFLTGRSRKI
jgi:uncharacterized membrane protein